MAEPSPLEQEQRRHRAIERLLLAAFVGGLVLLLAIGVASVAVVRQNALRTEAVSHAYRVQVAIGEARQLIEQTENARRGFAMTGDPLALASLRSAAAELPPVLARLDGLLREPSQRQVFAAIEQKLAALRAQHDATNALAAAGQLDAAIRLYRSQASPVLFRPLRGQFAALQRQERGRIAARTAERDAGLRLFYGVLATAGVLVLAMALLSLAVVLRYVRDLDRSRGALRRLNETLEERVSTRTADLSRANEEIQRFAYIVSHDLRSPLVNVMGFTSELESAARPLGELVDRAEAEAPAILSEDAKLAAREDLPEAIGFIRTSTERMDRLINAILRLSREGRRVIAPQPLDVAEIAEASVAAMRQSIDARGAAVTVQRPLPALVSDRVAIEQVLANLIENASKYLQPGRPGRIAVTGAREGDRVVLAVTDNGRGIAAADHQRIFDLFRRSGAQDQPGEGIGLAHVRALVYRLGGVIDVESQLGEGSTFRVSLPATFEEPRA